MATSTLAQMTKKEFTKILSNVVEQKLIELYGDPDEGLIIKDQLRKRLVHQKKATSKGDRGVDLSSAMKQLGLG
ncbi:MAG: hypothetical protein Q8S01_04485 [Ignavibacteria bacterium]|nr:hypothetical protein [Ignavibacteria bacterium]